MGCRRRSTSGTHFRATMMVSWLREITPSNLVLVSNEFSKIPITSIESMECLTSALSTVSLQTGPTHLRDHLQERRTRDSVRVSLAHMFRMIGRYGLT